MRHSRTISIFVIFAVLGTMGVAMGSAAMALDDNQVGFITTPGADAPMPIAPPDFESTERLVLTDEETVATDAQISVDPTVSTSTSFARMQSHFNTLSLEGRMAEANGSQEEIAVVSGELRRIQEQIDKKLALEREAYTAVTNGELDGNQFFRELSVLHIRSQIANEELDALSSALRDVIAPVTRDDAQRLRGEVSQTQLEARTLQGPASERGAAVMLAQESSMSTVEIRTSQTGYVLATIHDGAYIRESFASANRVRGSGAGFSDIEGARALTADLYPWTTANAVESEDIPRGEIFSSTIDHPHGTTGIFIDGETERAFRDNHELDLFSMPTVSVAEEQHEHLLVSFERTYTGGPIQIFVLDAESGESVSDASIEVSGRTVGETDPAGSLWFIAPSPAFDVNVSSEGEMISTNVSIPG